MPRQLAKNINVYLMDAENLFIENRGKPLCEVPEMGIGNDLRMSDEAIALELMRRSVKLASIVPKKKKRAMKRDKSK